MNYLELVFSYYDKFTANFSPNTQVLISVFILFFFLLQIYHAFKSGHWIFITALIICLPGTWPATRHVGNIILLVIKFLITRAQSAL